MLLTTTSDVKPGEGRRERPGGHESLPREAAPFDGDFGEPCGDIDEIRNYEVAAQRPPRVSQAIQMRASHAAYQGQGMSSAFAAVLIFMSNRCGLPGRRSKS